MQQVDDPAFLSVGTEVSAKYKGAFCEAKVRKVVRNIKCKVAYKQGLGSGTVSDDLIKGPLRVGAVVEVKHPEKRDYVEATITKIQDCSQYTVVFDDGDITTLRRTALCLKSGRHFNESETLDQLPLTHPEHFGNPVIGGRRGRRSRHLQDDSSDDDDDHDSKEVVNEKEEHIGKVVCVESTETKKKDKDKWFPGLVVSPTAQVTVRIRVKDEYLVRSFKDGRYYTVPKKEAMEFTRELAAKQEGPAVQAALQYLDHDTLPTHWDRDALFGLANSSSEYEGEFDSDSSDDEPREEKDHFVAQLYKFMDDRGTPINKGPTITNRDVDLYRLFRAVQKLGGYNRVTSQNHWKAITLRLGFSPATVSVTNLVKQAYKKFLQPFEEFDRKLGCSMTMTPRTNRSKGRSLVRANSVASPKPEVKEPKVVPVIAEESENTSESSTDASKSKRKLSTGSGKVKILIEKYEEKVKDEAETPSKPVKAVKEEQPPPQQPTISTPSTSKKEKHTKKQSQTEDKRGRKKKETESTEKTAEKAEAPPTAAEFPVEVGDKLKVYYHEKKVTYEAKVIEISVQQGTPLYLVHYTGWNTRYDEWVPRERIAENLTTNKTKRSKGNSSAPKPSPSNVPPNEGTKGTPSSDKSTSGPTSSTPTTAAKIVASKRGRGRSDSQPPRSSTPSSVTSSVSRTKSPAAPTPQRRTTRGQPSSSRRTSNNVSDISLQTDSDTDSDEPVKKPVRIPTTTAALTTSQAQSISTIAKTTKPATSNSQSETEEEEISVGAKGRDYDLNQIRSELKGFKELKSPSPESEPPTTLPAEKKPSVFEFSIIEENDTKPTIQSSVKPATPESKTSSTDLSSETDSYCDDDSQSSDKTTTLENMTEKFRRKIKAEKLAQAKCLERLGPNKGSEKMLPIKSSSIEKIIKDSLAEKYQETLKTKPFIAESSSFCSLDKEEKIKIPVEPRKCELKLITPERKPIQPAVQIEKKLTPAVEIKPSIVRQEKLADKVQVVLKPLQKEAPSPEVTILKPATIIPEKLVKEIAKPLSQIKPSTADIYEFKEPEPFEFEARKTPVVSLASLEIVEKKQKKLPQKPQEIIPEVVPKPTPPVAVVAKKNKKSPVKEPEKLKQIKIEEKEKPPTPESTSPINVLLSPTKIDATFDALRKSPSFNLSLSTLSDDSSSTSDTIKGTSTSTDKAETSNTAPSPPPIQSAPLPKIVPFISPFMETPKSDLANVFDLKADVENIDSDTDGDSLLGSKSGLETVKKILLADPDFDLEPPKIEKPSIADKVLKALSQQKQEEAQMKQEPPKAQVIEAPQITSFPITEPPKIELPAVIKKEIEIPLKKPILSSPEHKLDILESIAPKNNDLSETIQKLESAIQKTSTVDHFDEDSSDSTDSERRLVIEDDSQSSETNTAENLNDFPVPPKKSDNSSEKEVKEETESKEQPNFFTNKFPPSIFGIQASNFSCGSLLADPDVKPIVDLLPFKSESEQNIKSEAERNAEKNEAANSLLLVKKEESLLNQDNSNIHSESINLLLCEETIPGSPTPMKECSDVKPNLHPTESDIKPVPMDIESGSMTTTVDIIPQQMPKSDNNTPNSSPRDSLSLDDSSEDLKKHHEHDNDVSPKKRRRTRKHSEAESVTKRRRAAAAGVSKRNNGSDSDDNSDHNGNRTSVRTTKPCQYNFLVQLDPAMSSNQRIAILRKKIQDLRKTYNMIKAELASIDRRRKKLRRREREKKNQQKLAS